MDYFILLTYGEYSDYGIEGLYKSDHPVSQDEFDLSCKEFQKKRQEYYKAQNVFKCITFEVNWLAGWGKTDTHKEWIAWSSENEPVSLFVKKHSLIPVNYVEIHNG